MRRYTLVASVSASMLLFAACGGDDTTKGSDGGTGGSTGVNTGTATGAAATAGNGGGASVCEEFFAFSLLPAACNECLADECCAEIEACTSAFGCAGCFDGDVETGCDDMSAAYGPLLDCFDTEACTQDMDGLICDQGICDSGLVVGFTQAECASCLGTSCCPELTDCAADMDCLACITGDKMPNDPACMNSALLTTANTCWDTSCTMACGPTQ